MTLVIQPEGGDRWTDHWLLRSGDRFEAVAVDRPLSTPRELALAEAVERLNERDFPERRVDAPDGTHYYIRGYRPAW